jgi:hypothetical protein
MRRHFPFLFENIPEVTLRREKLFFYENIEFIDEEEFVNTIAIGKNTCFV